MSGRGGNDRTPISSGGGGGRSGWGGRGDNNSKRHDDSHSRDDGGGRSGGGSGWDNHRSQCRGSVNSSYVHQHDNSYGNPKTDTRRYGGGMKREACGWDNSATSGGGGGYGGTSGRIQGSGRHQDSGRDSRDNSGWGNSTNSSTREPKRTKHDEHQHLQQQQQQHHYRGSGGWGGWASSSASVAAAPAAKREEDVGWRSTTAWAPTPVKADGSNNEQACRPIDRNDGGIDGGKAKPLEEIVTKETWDNCTWDQKIASQHPDWPVGDHRTGHTYLNAGKKVEEILKTCPFDALKEYSKSEEWFGKKVQAAEHAFVTAWKEVERDDEDDEYCPATKEDVQRFFQALPYNMTFLIGWDVLGIYPKDEKHCLCPCGSKCAKWRRQFDLEGILEDFGSRDQCGNTMKSSQPHGLMQHLDQKGQLHHFVKLYIQELYGPPYCGKVGHKGLYPNSSREHNAAEAFEKKKNFQARKRLEKEVEEQRRAKLKLEEEAKKREKDLEDLKKLTSDQYERLQAQEEEQKLLNIAPTGRKETEDEVGLDAESMKQFRDMYRAFFESAKWLAQSGSKGSGGSVDIHVPHAFKAEDLFDELYKKKCFLFKSLDSKNENVGGKIVRDWKILFDTVSNHRNIKQETQPVDEGGPSREFMSLIWKRFTKLAVKVEGDGGKSIKIPLIGRDADTGYATFHDDSTIEDFLNKVPGPKQEEARQKVNMYFQGIGRLFLHALAIGTRIPTTVLPPFYRNYLLRGCCPNSDDYPRTEVYNDVRAMDRVTDIETILNCSPFDIWGEGSKERFTEETFYTIFLQKTYIDQKSIALINVRLGLTLDDRIGIPRFFKAVSPQVLKYVAFANPELTPGHVIEFLKPQYCTEVWDSPVEPQLIEEQKLFFEETLPSVLWDRYLAEKDDKESYKKKVRRNKDFLSRFVQYCTGSFHLPHPEIKSDSDMITIEFDATEVNEGNLPATHTCVNTIKFPHTSYSNDGELLCSKLSKAFQLSSKFGSFGMQ